MSRPWDVVRDVPWLAPQPDHTFSPLRARADFGAALLSETLHTIVVQPWCIRARLLGLYFDTNKCFLLPGPRAAGAGTCSATAGFEGHRPGGAGGSCPHALGWRP